MEPNTTFKNPMSAQEKTLQQYRQWMQLSAVSGVLQSARSLGIFHQLRSGQHTADQLCQALSLTQRPTQLLLDSLVAVGIIEKYDDDYALSRAAQLLCQYDEDLGESRWKKIAQAAKGENTGQGQAEAYYDHNAATQWSHTKSAIQAAEMLDIGEGQYQGLDILDLGCGSAVWSSAMGHRDPKSKITAVDHPGALQSAQNTAKSIGLSERFTTIASDPIDVELPTESFDVVLIAQRLHALGAEPAVQLLSRAVEALRPGGRLIVIDLFRGPGKISLSESLEALKLELDTENGAMRTLKESEAAFRQAGMDSIQFTFLAASEINLGMMVAFKQESPS